MACLSCAIGRGVYLPIGNTWHYARLFCRTVWDNLFPQEQHRIMGLLIERVQLHEDGLDIIWRDDSWQKFSRELAGHPFVVEQRERVGQVGARAEMEVA